MIKTPDRAYIMRALELADADAVRAALYQLTNDPALAALPTAAAMDATQKAWLNARAADWLEADTGSTTITPPEPGELRALMEMALGAPMGDLEFEARHELVSFDPFPYFAKWENGRPNIPEGFKVAIIGGGFSGLTMAVQLQQLGIDFFVVERRSEPGGVWSINRYPDARVDTISITYELPFVKDKQWSEYFARGSEVREYIEETSRQFGVFDKTSFGHDVTSVIFDEARNIWRLECDTADGPVTLEANVVVGCSGLYATPNIPAFEGAEDFAGRIVHPSRWPDDLDLSGRKVATMGNGSTGVQLLSAIAADAEHVTVFQRTPQWIMPREKYGDPIPEEIAWLCDALPGYRNWWRFTAVAPLFDTHEIVTLDAEWQAQGGLVNRKSDEMRTFLTGYIQQQTNGRQDLIDRLTPDYAPFARRPVVDNGWYKALTQDHVELETASIRRLVPNGIETSEGKVHEADVIVCATGFTVQSYFSPTRYIGRGGVDLHQRWDEGDGPRAYIGIMYPQFPNLFTLYGPNSQPISGGPSQPVWFAMWAAYAARAIMRMLETGASRVEVTQDGFDRYNRELDAASGDLVAMSDLGGADRNYYVNQEKARLQVNAPWYAPDYWRMCRYPVAEELTFS